MTYKDMIRKHRRDFELLPIRYAFGSTQFYKMLRDWNVSEEELVSVGCGGYMRKCDVKLFENVMKSHNEEFESLIEADKSGEGFIEDMFEYELNNHEYSYTDDISDALHALGISVERLNSDKRLMRGLKIAMKKCK